MRTKNMMPVQNASTPPHPRSRDISRVRTIAIITSCVAVSVACSTVKSNHDYDPEVNFSELRTYAWMPDQPRGQTRVLHTDKLLLDRIQRAVDNDLSSKGLRKVPPANASFLIRSLIGVDQEDDVAPTLSGQGQGKQAVRHGSSIGSTRRQRHHQGTLILDFIDAHDERLIWRGTGQIRLKRNTAPKEREKRIQDGVHQILSHYPPATSG